MLRYSEKQFDVYNELWASLCELEICVNTLWEKATESSVRNLARQINFTRNKIRLSALLIEDRHYREFNIILNQFECFQFGKQNLIEMRNMKHESGISSEDIVKIINNNSEIKDRLIYLLLEIMACFRSQIARVQ